MPRTNMSKYGNWIHPLGENPQNKHCTSRTQTNLERFVGYHDKGYSQTQKESTDPRGEKSARKIKANDKTKYNNKKRIGIENKYRSITSSILPEEGYIYKTEKDYNDDTILGKAIRAIKGNKELKYVPTDMYIKYKEEKDKQIKIGKIKLKM